MQPESENFVSIRNLNKDFGSFRALDDVSITAPKGKTLVLLGPSGCGKTTLLRCIAGLEDPTGGKIEIGGRTFFGPKTNLKPDHRDIGVVFQSYAIWPHMTVAENIGFPLKVRKAPAAEIAAKVSRIAEVVGLGHLKDRSSMQLSGGQQQRVALARALIHEPALVLFDEALSNLDAQLREQMRLELKVLQARLGFTAVYVTHDQTEAFGLADKVVLMNAGRIEVQGHPEEIFRAPSTAFAARFLGFNIVTGTLAEVGAQAGLPDGFAAVSLGGGTRLVGRLMTPAQPGRAVLACVRKEHVEPAAEGAATLSARVVAQSFLGLQREFLLAGEGFELRAIRPADEPVPGTSLGVSVQAERCFVFADQRES